MSEAAPALELLSREEIDALVEELSRARRDEGEARRLPGLAGADEGGARGAGRALRRALQQFARAQSRALASRFQRPIELRLLGVEELRAGDLAELLLPHDRIVVFGVGESRGFAWIGRPLFFAWMRLALGARRELRAEPLPDRAPTPIELRFVRRIGAELLDHLGAALEGAAPLVLDAIEDAAALRERRAARLAVASFDVDGFEEIGRLRIALPRALAVDAAPAARLARDDHAALARAVLDAPVVLSIEIGGAELPLLRIARLEVGALIPIDAPGDGLALVHVDGAPKFRARRGQLGPRLAIQIEERLAAEEE
ncbi:MAG: hypothetical protein DCC71_12345 [Proteobacteria bacterium]|nr:MAG: hypothetical protein DCC71_12345 [Pseudomonadota bacterium]